MEIHCPQCKFLNTQTSRFCNQCGQALPAVAQKAKIGLPLIIVLSVLGLCGMCGIIGALNDKKKDTAQTNTAANNVQQAPPAQIAATPPPTFADLKAKVPALLNFKKDEYSQADLKQFDDVMTPLRAIPKEDKNYKEAQTLVKKLIDKSSVIGAEIVVLGDKPMQSGWDGDVLPVKQYLRTALNDYDSSEFVEWSPVSKVYIGKEPYWGVRLKLRAKNAFGAYIVRDTFYFIRNNQVVQTKGL